MLNKESTRSACVQYPEQKCILKQLTQTSKKCPSIYAELSRKDNVLQLVYYAISFACCSLLSANHQQVETPATQNPFFASDGETEKSECFYFLDFVTNESTHLLLLDAITGSQGRLRRVPAVIAQEVGVL